MSAPGSNSSAPIEMIDIIFAISNVKLVREIVTDNLRRLEDVGSISKGQTEGLRHMIIDRQNKVHSDLADVEAVLTDIMKRSVEAEPGVISRNEALNPAQSSALIYALSFAVSHLMKFIPSPHGINEPGTII